ncbi:MAG: glycosyltransferase, partial [Prevotellaceae bacterium]|nr:glycosyltransferase [Prevotellaceae bacterium]
MKNIFVSFVLPAYKAAFLRKAVDSILAQTYTDFELVIVNDASPENIEDIVLSYHDDRIRYYKNRENIGRKSLVAQWNHCIDYAKGEYLVLASDDDIYQPTFLEECVNLAMKYPEVDLIRSRVLQIDSNDSVIGVDALLPEWTSKYEYFYYWMTGSAFVCIGNFMFKSSALKSNRFIDFPCAFGADSASTIQLSQKGVANTKEMLFCFRSSSIHLSGSTVLYKEKLLANTMLFSFLYHLDYSLPENELDKFYFSFLTPTRLYEKCRYDYY